MEIDFTDIDLYPRRYQYVNGKAKIQSLVIENIERQKEKLIAKKTLLKLGDAIRVSFKFGHDIGREKENWIDVSVSGVYIVTKIVQQKIHNEIELEVREK